LHKLFFWGRGENVGRVGGINNILTIFGLIWKFDCGTPFTITKHPSIFRLWDYLLLVNQVTWQVVAETVETTKVQIYLCSI